MNKIIAFVTAKGHSERVPNKNSCLLGDKPLFWHAIIAARESKLVTKVVIDSDSDKILDIGAIGATPLKRPAYLANNNTTGDNLAYWEAGNYPESELIVQISPTAPFLLPGSIDRAISLIHQKNVDSVAGVREDVFYEWIDGKPTYMVDGKIPNSFDKKPIMYETTGLNVVRTKFVLAHKKRINPDSCYPCHLSKTESVDINTIEDFEFAKVVWAGMQF